MSLMFNNDMCKIPYMYKESKLGVVPRGIKERLVKEKTLEFNVNNM